MSNPEKRDERSMSDILASIRKIMAQEPTLAMPPSPPRPSLNGVTGGTIELPREPELKLPAEKKPSEGASAPAPVIGPEPVSLDELLAETPRATPAAKPAPKPAGGASSSGPASPAAPEWLFPKPNAGEPAKDQPAPAPAKDIAAKSPALPVADPQPAAPAAKAEAPEPAKTTQEPATPPSALIGPPTPRLGDLGSVVPGKREDAGSQPTLTVGPPAPGAPAERPVLGPPLAGPLLGEPTRTAAASEPLPEVPGADALRRLIANVVPPSAHPSLAPAAKTPEPVPAKPADMPKPDGAAKAAPELKVEMKAAPLAEAKKPATVGPLPSPVPPPAAAPAAAPDQKPAAAAPTPAPKPVAATPAPVPAPVQAQAPKPAAPAPAAQKPETPPQPAPAATSAGPAVPKTMDETVVELLRPLLREWLEKNMPRLIEPALKAEIEALRGVLAKDGKKD